jgi:hypothetical protein
MTMRTGKFSSFAYGPAGSGLMGRAEGATSPAQAITAAEAAARGMYYDGHMLAEAVRATHSIEMKTFCGKALSAPLPLAADFDERAKMNITCHDCYRKWKEKAPS